LTREQYDTLENIYYQTVNRVKDIDGTFQLQSHLKSDLGSELPLHLSLSQPNVLKTEQRDGFLETLMDRFMKARVKP
jgi:hypothetical protein